MEWQFVLHYSDTIEGLEQYYRITLEYISLYTIWFVLWFLVTSGFPFRHSLFGIELSVRAKSKMPIPRLH